MEKIKAFVKAHKGASIAVLIVLVLLAIGGANQYKKYQKQQQFYAEHPLVNKVYKFYYRELPAAGGVSSGTDYYIFGNNKYRNKVVEFNSYNGGLKAAKEALHDKAKYKKAFEGRWAEEYVVKDGNKLIIGSDLEDAEYQIKKGDSWVGMYTQDGEHDESAGEVHKFTPVNLK